VTTRRRLRDFRFTHAAPKPAGLDQLISRLLALGMLRAQPQLFNICKFDPYVRSHPGPFQFQLLKEIMPRKSFGLLILALCFLRAESSLAQVSPNQRYGTILGTVLDPTGTGIPGVLITVIEQSTGKHFETKTDCEGTYRISNLAAGSYQVRIEAEGFVPEIKNSERVSPALITHLDSKLRISVLSYGGPQIETGPPAFPAGSIFGSVKDTDGAAVPARITAIEHTKGNPYKTTTDSNGVFRLRDLPPGSYDVKYESESTSGSSDKPVNVRLSEAACVDIRLPITKSEVVEVCSAACMIDTSEISVALAHQGIELRIHADRNVMSPGADLWVKVDLRNMTSHPIFLYTGTPPSPIFGYQIFAFGSCQCPGELHGHELGVDPLTGKHLAAAGADGPIVRVPPNGTLTDHVALNTIMDLTHPGSYRIVVERPDPSSALNWCEEPKGQPLVISNAISVAVIAASQ